jgi:signal transduction histidine kinase/CheY-like chemotaxis protein
MVVSVQLRDECGQRAAAGPRRNATSVRLRYGMSAAVRSEQIRTLYGQSLPLHFANLANASIVVILLHDSRRQNTLLVWLSAMALLTVARLELLRRYRRKRPGAEAIDDWGAYFVAGSAAAGVLWGAAGALFFDPSDVWSQVLVSFVVGGMGAGAAATLSCHMPAFVAYFLPSILPLAVSMFATGDRMHTGLGVITLVYGVGLFGVARITNRSITQAFSIGFENDALLERLSAIRTRLEHSNWTLEQRVNERTAELEQQAETLRTAQRMEAVGRLAGGVAHDFNNLLTVVVTNASSLASDPRVPASVQPEIEEIRGAAARGTELVRQLLTFSRREQVKEQVIDLNECTRETERLFRRLIGEHVRVELALAEGVLPVRGDPGQLEQVLLNLVTNARDAMPDGGKLTITTASRRIDDDAALPPGDYVTLTVADTGVGMAEDTVRHAFEPFFTTKEDRNGTGLGLSSVYAVVSRSGGRVSVDSAPGKGSRFCVFLPHASGPVSQRVQVTSDAPSPQRRATVLLAEDEPNVRNATARVLRRAGHEVLLAEDGKRALEVARNHPGDVDVLVTDVVMSRMGGPELARVLLAERPGLRVLFVSGYSWNEDLPDSDPSRGIAYLRKPFSPPELVQKLSELLSPATQLDARAG